MSLPNNNIKYERLPDLKVTEHDVNFTTRYSRSKTKNYTYDCVSKKEDPRIFLMRQEEFLRPDTDKQIIGVIFPHQKKTVF